MTDDQRELAAWHEAGHAVAAVMRGGSRLASVVLGERHGTGLTMTSSKPFDSAFITYAGPWAEARQQWGDRPLDDEDDEGHDFDNYVAAVFLEQPVDTAELRAAYAWSRSLGVPSELLRQGELVWAMELERVWPAIAQVAEALVADAVVTDDMVRTLVAVPERRLADESGGPGRSSAGRKRQTEDVPLRQLTFTGSFVARCVPGGSPGAAGGTPWKA